MIEVAADMSTRGQGAGSRPPTPKGKAAEGFSSRTGTEGPGRRVNSSATVIRAVPWWSAVCFCEYFAGCGRFRPQL